MNNDLAIESFITFCDDMMIVEESILNPGSFSKMLNQVFMNFTKFISWIQKKFSDLKSFLLHNTESRLELLDKKKKQIEMKIASIKSKLSDSKISMESVIMSDRERSLLLQELQGLYKEDDELRKEIEKEKLKDYKSGEIHLQQRMILIREAVKINKTCSTQLINLQMGRNKYFETIHFLDKHTSSEESFIKNWEIYKTNFSTIQNHFSDNTIDEMKQFVDKIRCCDEKYSSTENIAYDQSKLMQYSERINLLFNECQKLVSDRKNDVMKIIQQPPCRYELASKLQESAISTMILEWQEYTKCTTELFNIAISIFNSMDSIRKAS